jgi:hypothetical protein
LAFGGLRVNTVNVDGVEVRMAGLTHRYRVFVSFSHDDRDRVERIYHYLQGHNLNVRWTGSLLPGVRFAEQIREGISTAHLFLPVMTASAVARPWVHQEIGFALGVNVPVLPLALGKLPGGMADELQVLSLEPDLSNLEVQLRPDRIEYLAGGLPSGDAALFERAAFQEDRTRMLGGAADRVLKLDGPARVRQRGSLPSFTLPDKPHSGEIWQRCDGAGHPRSPAFRRDLQQERRRLEKHARQAGCDLIINPAVVFRTRGPGSKQVRMEVLLEFLEGMPDDKARVIVAPPTLHDNLLILGDWFLAESITSRSGQGYLQTLGTWHAPTVLQRMREFDVEFEREVARVEAPGRSSRQIAIDRLREEVDRLRSEATGSAGSDAPRSLQPREPPVA